ncbi:LuxR C-terminal-related transcriptional regulator [Mycobacterium parmense]|uniref:Transcriptional regulator n=1 Tax=Mycobacterium parmense TaxID=185642 RepID=A0A7I7YW79_9MYCO|nr:LuxR family transcriptional regulator [Mycobacterium parmense]MCV7350438.1 AAA family ATPase [Mycobacterium parmense]ORW48172.1 LuxR family transcriptional regulator [Mycobacterium parmense]BBZ46138.1 transcriptional regulator [Mycobacterium parmense]
MIGADLLTGRDSELAAIRRALSGVGNSSGAVIAGAAGVGKTRLAREVLARAEASGERTYWIVGTQSARQLPLGAFTPSICDAVPDPISGVRRVINSFIEQQRRGRVLIGVDDAHLLDGLSAHVIHQLAQARGTRLLVTVRTGGDEADAITALWKDELLARLDLQPLSAPDVRRIIEGALGGAVDSRSARRFWQLTGGNALFVRQLLKDQIAAGAIKQVAGVWMWDERVAVSDSLGDMVGRQLSRLQPEVAAVVDTLSQYEPLAVDVLCDLVARADLEEAERLGLVIVERTGPRLLARLAHPLFGELRRAVASEMYLSRIRGRLAQRLARHADADVSATVRRALLTLESDLPPDPQLYLRAAQLAMTLLDLDLSDRFAAAAAEAGISEAEGLRAISLAGRGHGEKAEAILAGIGVDDPDGHHWATVRAANLVWNLGRPRDAAAILDGLATTPESEAQRAERAAVEACVDAVMARCGSAADKARAALSSPTLPDFHAMLASVALTTAQGALGKITDISEMVGRAMDRAITSFQASPMRFWYGAVYARACRLNGRIDECVRAAQQLAESVRDVPGLAYANLAFLLGQAELVRGDLRAALTLLHEAQAGAQKHSVTTGLRAASCFALAEAHAKLGEADAADEAIRQARQHVPADYLFMQTGLALAGGWALAAGGRLADATSIVRAAREDARTREQPTHEVACLQAAAQWGDASGAARARELADILAFPLACAVARHTDSLATGDGEGLLKASADYRAIGDRAAAADVAAQAAVAFSRNQQRKRSLYAAAVAQELATECGGLCTPALRNPIGQPLTDRQREIIELVAAGLSHKEIAERLVTSVRTVEGHVYRAYQRLGAGSREELVEMLRAGPRA